MGLLDDRPVAAAQVFVGTRLQANAGHNVYGYVDKVREIWIALNELLLLDLALA